MTSSRRKDERVHKNAIFNRLTAGVSSAFNTYTFLNVWMSCERVDRSLCVEP